MYFYCRFISQVFDNLSFFFTEVVKINHISRFYCFLERMNYVTAPENFFGPGFFSLPIKFFDIFLSRF